MLTLLRQHDITAVTAVCNAVLEIDLFCCQILEGNNFVSKYYFQTKFCGSFTDTFRIKCLKICEDTFRFGIFIERYLGGYFFPDTV